MSVQWRFALLRRHWFYKKRNGSRYTLSIPLSNKPTTSSTAVSAGLEHKRFLSISAVKKAYISEVYTRMYKPAGEGFFLNSGVIIRVPNVPDATPENNLYLEYMARNADWPPMESTTREEMYEGTLKLIMDWGATIFEHIDYLREQCEVKHKGQAPYRGPCLNYKGYPVGANFDNTLLPLLADAHDAIYALHTLRIKMQTDWPLKNISAMESDMRALVRLYENTLQQFTDEPELVDAVQYIADNEQEMATISEWEHRFVKCYLRNRELQGYVKDSLRSKKLYQQESNNMEAWAYKFPDTLQKYWSNIFYDQQNVPIIQTKPHWFVNAPQDAIERLRFRDWKASIEPNTLFPVLRYCRKREVRQQLWEAWVQRAGFLIDEWQRSNVVIIEELRDTSEEFARDLGYDTTVEFQLQGSMAGNKETVRDFIDTCREELHKVYKERYVQWDKYANKFEGINSNEVLATSDLFYICQREAEFYHDLNLQSLQAHFPVMQTFEKIMAEIGSLFNLGFEDISQSGLERCDPSVRIYKVTDLGSNEHLGRLYVDLLKRANKCADWATELWRTSNTTRGLDQLVYILASLDSRDQDWDINKLPSVQELLEMRKQKDNLEVISSARMKQDPGLNLILNMSDEQLKKMTPMELESRVYADRALVGQPGTLDHDNLGKMLFQFGRALQLLLSRSPYWNMIEPHNSFKSLERDLGNFVGTFVKFMLYKRNFLKNISSPHTKTGKPMSLEQAEKMAGALRRATFFETYRMLFWSDFDNQIFTRSSDNENPWHEIYRDLFDKYFMYFSEQNHQPCSFTPIIANPHTYGTYYRHLWVEMIALDVHELFCIEGDEQATAERLKKTWLNHGCLKPQMEMFMAFKGIAPSTSAFIRFYDPEPTQEQLHRMEKLEEEEGAESFANLKEEKAARKVSMEGRS